MNQLIASCHKTPSLRLPLLLLAACTLPVFTERAYAIVKPFDDSSELFITGTASIAENDNIFLSHDNETSALIFDFIPGISYEAGKDNSDTQTKLAVSEDFQEYTNGSNLNEQLTNASLTSRYDDEKTKLDLLASFNQFDQPEVGLQNASTLVERNVTNVDGTGEISMSDKSSMGVGLDYSDTSYQSSGYTDWSYFQVPVDYYWKVEPKLDLSAGFRYRDNTVGTGGIDSQNYYYNVGARGEFAPDLTGEFDVGYNQLSLDRHGSQSALGADSKFTYVYSPKTSVIVSLNEDYGYSAIGGGGYRQPNAYVGITTALDEQWSVNGQVSYAQYQYIITPQRDNFYSAQIGITYAVNTHISIHGAYNYAQDDSNITADSFTNNIFTVSASIRY